MRKIPIMLSLSDLQAMILIHICTTENATYNSLLDYVVRNRVTVLQSVESLIRYNYIRKQKLDPEHEKSKLIFIPTNKGKAFAWHHLGVSLKTMIRTDDGEEITDYIQFIKDVFKESYHKYMVNPLFSDLEHGYLEREDDLRNSQKHLIKDSFRRGLFELIQQKNYDAKLLFGDKSIRWIKKLYSTIELKEFKDIFTRARDNLNMTIAGFPD